MPPHINCFIHASIDRHNFHLRDEETKYVLEVECPRYMETSLIDCDVQPTYVRLNIKSKVTISIYEYLVHYALCIACVDPTIGVGR